MNISNTIVKLNTGTFFSLVFYNISSCSVYFISSIFFIPHIENLSFRSTINIPFDKELEKYVIIFAIIGFLIMFFAQYFTLKEKALGVTSNKSCILNTIIELGIGYKSLIMCSSAYTIFCTIMGYLYGSLFMVFVSIGVFIVNSSSYKYTRKYSNPYFWFILSIFYSVSLTLLYFNVMNHVNDVFITSDNAPSLNNYISYTLSIIPIFLFSLLFFLGILSHSMSLRQFKSHKNRFTEYIIFFFSINSLKIFLSLFVPSQETCIHLSVLWKTMVNSMSILFLVGRLIVYFNINFNRNRLLLIAALIFTILYNTQVVWFTKK